MVRRCGGLVWGASGCAVHPLTRAVPLSPPNTQRPQAPIRPKKWGPNYQTPWGGGIACTACGVGTVARSCGSPPTEATTGPGTPGDGIEAGAGRRVRPSGTAQARPILLPEPGSAPGVRALAARAGFSGRNRLQRHCREPPPLILLPVPGSTARPAPGVDPDRCWCPMSTNNGVCRTNPRRAVTVGAENDCKRALTRAPPTEAATLAGGAMGCGPRGRMLFPG